MMRQAAVYLRISQDRTGLQAGIQRQQEDCLAHAAKLTFAEPQVFVDNDVSAFDGGRRPGYDALASQVRAGVTHIIVWHVDRLYRQPRELEDLIDLVEQHPVRIEAVRRGGCPYIYSWAPDGVWSLVLVWLICPVIDDPGGVAARNPGRALTADRGSARL